MPYIEQGRRSIFNKRLEGLMDSNFIEKGDLTYYVYKLGLDYIKQKGENYQNISDAIAALNDAAAELRRRVLNPYEDLKINENSDIL